MNSTKRYDCQGPMFERLVDRDVEARASRFARYAHEETSERDHLLLLLRELSELSKKLDRIESDVSTLKSMAARPQLTKEMYTTAEVADIVGLAKFTIREHCRAGRILAEKRMCGRGRTKEWAISREEIERFQNEGLLPR